MSQSYFFACIPRYLKVDHSFAKTIKPNTKYRVVMFKGIQKGEGMKEGVRSKLVGGKIDLESPELFFNIPFFNSTKNIHFTLKLFEEKPTEEQTQVGSFTIMSSDYIRSYKNENQTFFQIDAMLKDDLFIAFDLFVQKSKFTLTDALKKYTAPTTRKTIQTIEDAKSQSSSSKQVVRQGDGFMSPRSPRKMLQRKTGHKGKLISRNSSRSDGEMSPEGSVASSRRKWKKSPPSGERFMHSPNKANPVKDSEKRKSIPKSEAYESNKNAVEKPQVTRSNVVSPPFKRGVQSPVSQSAVRQPPSQTGVTQSISPRTTTQIPAQNNFTQSTSPKTTTQPTSQYSRQPITQPRSSKNNRASQFEVKDTPQVFDVVLKKNGTSLTSRQSKVSQPYQYQPQPASKGLSDPKSTTKKVDEKISQKDNQPSNKPIQIGFKKTQSFEHEKIEQTPEKSLKNKVITNDDKSQKTSKQIQVKGKPVKKFSNTIFEEGTLKRSQRVTEVIQHKKKDQESLNAQKLAAQMKNQILYVIFLVVSAFLIYNAMMPTRRV